jgi:uncharacterized membrane protein YfcA
LELELYHYLVAIIGGFIAGAINTLAGNGSAITLSILTEVMGLPGNMANGTNRVGVFFQSLGSSTAFYRNKKLPLASSRIYILLTTVGAVLGVLVAIQVSNEQFLSVFKFLMLFMLIVILVKPKRWFRETELNYKLPIWISVPVFLALGFYGGFIQMGMGIFFLAAMVLLARYNLIEANAVKIFVVFIYTIFILIIFQWRGLIDWKIGGIIAIGQMTGGYLTAHYASKFKSAEIWAYRLLVIIVVWAILSLFGLIPKL